MASHEVSDSTQIESMQELENVCKLMSAYKLIGEVSASSNSFVLDLLPSNTDEFLEEASANLTKAYNRMLASDSE